MRGRAGLMTTAGTTNLWTGSQAAPQRLSVVRANPQPMSYAVYRDTTFADHRKTAHFVVQGQDEPMSAVEFQRWISARFPDGDANSQLSLLVIRETLGPDDRILDCTIERHRGAIDGPYTGEPARVEFSGPARAVRLCSVDALGRLFEAPAAPTSSADPQAEPTNLPLAGEEAALRGWFGPNCTVVSRRAPTSNEELIGLSSIYHVRADTLERSCGVAWFGPIPFVLVADFPRTVDPVRLPAVDEAVVEATIRSRDLIRGDLRLDDPQWCLIARSRQRPELFRIRPVPGGLRVDPYVPEWRGIGSEDQRRWVDFATTHERRTPIDAYQDITTGDLVVLTTGEDDQFWRHRIDPDGIEVSSELANDSAVAIVHRAARDPEAEPPVPSDSTGTGPRTRPPEIPPEADTLLAKTRAVTEAGIIFRDAMASTAGWAEVRDHLARLSEVLGQLKAKAALASLRRRLRAWDQQEPTVAERVAGVNALRRGLTEEMASLRVIVLELDRPDPGATELIAETFPEARFHLDEAEQCLALRRPTGAMFHAMHLLLCGLRALSIGEARRPGEWRPLMRAVERRDDLPASIRATLDKVRRCWHAGELTPAEKYTVEEAEAALDAVHAFLRAAAEVSASDPIRT